MPSRQERRVSAWPRAPLPHRGIGDLVLVYKRISGLAGHTSRVSELVEQVRQLSGEQAQQVHVQLYLRNVSSSGILLPPSPHGGVRPLPEPARVEGDTIKFNRCGQGVRAPGWE